MLNMKRIFVILLVCVLTVVFVQFVGGYLVSSLKALETTEMQEGPKVEEKIVKQLILHLEPQEYYTILLGSYMDATKAQEKIDLLAKAGYRVFVSDGPPYQLCVGCFGIIPQIDELPKEIQYSFADVSVQKRILNSVVFRFSETMDTNYEELSMILASLDIVLKHSLKLFQDYRYIVYQDHQWEGMIVQIQDELQQIQHSVSDFLVHAQNEALIGDLLNLTTVAENYRESLQLILDKKNTQVVLLSQSCLLELISYYHSFIEQHSNAEV